jgi:hypothetical protein
LNVERIVDQVAENHEAIFMEGIDFEAEGTHSMSLLYILLGGTIGDTSLLFNDKQNEVDEKESEYCSVHRQEFRAFEDEQREVFLHNIVQIIIHNDINIFRFLYLLEIYAK